MGRIGATLSGTERMLLNRLADANAAATINSLRLATEKKVNAPADNPSAFITLSRFQSRLSDVTVAMSNVTAASSMISQAQATLDQVRTQLNAIRTELVADEDRGLTAAERAEAQANIDAAVAQINTLAGTEIDGRRLLDGSADFDVAGRNSSQVAELRVHSTVAGSTPTISGTVTRAAEHAELVYAGDPGSVVKLDATFTLTGDLGSAEIDVSEDEALSSVATKINDVSHQTGVTASVEGNDLTFTSVKDGSSAELAIVVTDGTFEVTGGNGEGTANGTDASARINGVDVTHVDGDRFTFSSNGLHFEIEFVPEFTGDFDSITVSGNALTFALSTDANHRSTLAIPGLQPARLGGPSGRLDQIASGGLVSGLDGNTSQAIRIVDEALADLTRIEGSVDGFFNAAVTTSSNLLADLEEDLQDAITETDGYDENEETVLLLKNQQLAANALAGLTVLNQQRAGIVAVIQQIAGLN